jgi:hypothetical protein
MYIVQHIYNETAQAVSGWFFTAEPWVHSRVTLCEILDGRSGTRLGLSRISSVLPC